MKNERKIKKNIYIEELWQKISLPFRSWKLVYSMKPDGCLLYQVTQILQLSLPCHWYQMITQKEARTWGAISFILSVNCIWLASEQSQIGFFFIQKTYFPSYVRSMVWVTIKYKNHAPYRAICGKIYKRIKKHLSAGLFLNKLRGKWVIRKKLKSITLQFQYTTIYHWN